MGLSLTYFTASEGKVRLDGTCTVHNHIHQLLMFWLHQQLWLRAQLYNCCLVWMSVALSIGPNNTGPILEYSIYDWI